MNSRRTKTPRLPALALLLALATPSADAAAAVPARLTHEGRLLDAGGHPFTGKQVIITDPVTKLPFANNQIPKGRFDPASLNVLKYLPAAQNPNGQVFFSTPVAQDYKEFITRADYAIATNDRLNFRFNEHWYDQPGIFANNNLLTYALGTPDSSCLRYRSRSGNTARCR